MRCIEIKLDIQDSSPSSPHLQPSQTNPELPPPRPQTQPSQPPPHRITSVRSGRCFSLVFFIGRKRPRCSDSRLSPKRRKCSCKSRKNKRPKKPEQSTAFSRCLIRSVCQGAFRRPRKWGRTLIKSLNVLEIKQKNKDENKMKKHFCRTQNWTAQNWRACVSHTRAPIQCVCLCE